MIDYLLWADTSPVTDFHPAEVATWFSIFCIIVRGLIESLLVYASGTATEA
jgi:hypothetical protein